MSRRPGRSCTRHGRIQPTASHREHVPQSKAQLAKQARPKPIDFLSGPESAQQTISRHQKTHDVESDDDIDVDSDGDEEDIDTPRVAQWIDDDENFELQEQTASHTEGDDNDYSESDAGHSRSLRSLEDDLSTLPLGTLRSAQRSLAQAQPLSDSDSDSEEQFEEDSGTSRDDDASSHLTKSRDEEKPGKPSKPKKRSNKHAPAEVTSKRPVSRRRVVVDDMLPKPRDPRFMHAAGRYDPSKFKQRYEFLSDLRNDELVTLRGHVKRARNLLANSPAQLRTERKEEVKRLEHAMKRAESTVNLDNRGRVERKALQSAKLTEKEKRVQGKAGWWMKRSEKKELLAKARLDAIASVGGKQAVKKAIEKKRKKISQKEKKMRPFPRSERIEMSDGKRRRPTGSVDSGRGVKRRKVV